MRFGNDEGMTDARTGSMIVGRLLGCAARRLGSRLTISAVAGLLIVVATVALPLVVLAQDATLSTLSLSSGTLRPTFAATTTEYRAAVQYNVSRITVTATAATGVTVEYLDASDLPLADTDTNTNGHQVDLGVGETAVKVKVTSGADTETYTVTVERNSAYLFGWTPTRDITALQAAGNASPKGIWANATTMWIADDEDYKLYAYMLATGAYDSSKDITLHSDNGDPQGIWSDETTIWVADDEDDKLYAYALSDGTRQDGTGSTTDMELNLHADNGDPAGIWSDGTTIWVANNSGSPRKVFAYTLSGGASDTAKEFAPGSNPVGIWAHGTTMWVISYIGASVGTRVDAYAITGVNHGLQDKDKRFRLRTTVGTTPVGIWSDGKGAVWITAPDSLTVESYNMLPFSAGSTTLSALAINDGTSDATLRPAFALTTLNYRASVTDDVNRITISATPSENTATVDYLDANGEALVDADSSAGFQVNVGVGTTPIQILVTGQDGAALIHSAFVERDSGLPGGWTPTKDLYDLDPVANQYPKGIWSNGTTMWVTNTASSTVFAYALATSARDAGKDITLHTDNGNPQGIWANTTTIWVSDSADRKLYAYTRSTKARDDNKDIALHADNAAATDIWSNGTTVWVSDRNAKKLFAYALDGGARDADKEVELTANGLRNAGIWSNGTTVWVSDVEANRLYAYTLATKARDEPRDIALAAPFPAGVWGNGTTIWVADNGLVFYGAPTALHRVFSYRLPPSTPNAVTLSSLGVSPFPAVSSFTANLRPTFSFVRAAYRVAVPNQASRVTVSATANNGATTVEYRDANGDALVDADLNTTGFQVDVAVGETSIAMRLASGGTALTYTVLVERDSVELYVWTPTKDFNNLLQDNPDLAGDALRGVWGDATTMYVAPQHFPKVFAYTRATGARNESKDIETNQGSRLTEYGFKTGIWSDGTTMWVLNYRYGEDMNEMEVGDGTGKVFAFNLSDGVRDTTKEFPLHLGATHSARGIWSDGTTVWVSDYKAAKLFAYNLDDGVRQETKDITLHHLNNSAQGIWSDGTTIWVAQWNSPKFFAYDLATGAYDPEKDFDRVPGNHFPREVWSDGTTLYVTDHFRTKLFAYNMTDPGSEARLHSLELSGVTLAETFDTDTQTYIATTTAEKTTVTTTPLDPDATAVIKLNGTVDADGTVNLAAGSNVITVEVTAQDGTTMQTYTVTVTRAGEPGKVLVSKKLLSLTEGNTGYYSVVLDRRPTASVTVTIGGHTGTNVTPTPTSLTFTTADWSRSQQVEVSTTADTNTTNESFPLTHTASSTDSLFDDITIPSVIVNVDDQDAPDHHLRTITVPYDLPLGATALPEEEFEVWIGPPFEETIVGVTQGHRWSPSGIWGDPDPSKDMIWVVDPIHFGIHALKLSALKEGRVERHIAAGTSEFDYRFNYRCHFSESRASGYGNPSLTVMWGSPTRVLIANESSGTLDVYDRNSSITEQCYTRNVMSWAPNGQSYTTADEEFQSPFVFTGSIALPLGPLTVWGIWANSTRVWLSGPTGGVYTLALGGSRQMNIAPGYDGHTGSSNGLWSDGTTMWVATDSGWLRAYNLNSGIRSAKFDIRIQTDSTTGDIWSDGETIWVTSRAGKIDAYRLPDRPYASSVPRTSRAIASDPLTASFALAPEAHDGENGFKLRIVFSDDVEITPEDMRDHALLVSGGTVTDAAKVKGRSDLWELTVEPAGPGPVSILAPLGRACTDQGALCTADGRSLTAGPALQVPGPQADGPPDAPDRPEGTAVFVGGVDLEWNDFPGADSYDVQQYRGGQWTDLPADGVAIAFYGAGAIISGLDPESSLWFRVRAANAHGVSDWSEMLYMNSTSQFKSGRQARPDNEPASGAPVVHGTAQVGGTLWADATGIEDGNGLDRVQFQIPVDVQ